MKYLIALVVSAMLLLGMIGPTITINVWHKLLYNKEDTKGKKRKEYKITLIIWALLTIGTFIFAIFFVD